MIDLDGTMEYLESDGSHVRLYHAKSLKQWVAQTHEEDGSGRATRYATADTPEKALERLLMLSGGGPTGEATLALQHALRDLRVALKARTRAQLWGR